MAAANFAAGSKSSCSRCGGTLTVSDTNVSCHRCAFDLALDSGSADTARGSWLDLETTDTPSGSYELLEEIARGGMGVVYRARHRGLNRLVALKMILPQQLQSAAALERFRAEAEAIAALDHPGILPIYEVGELDGIPFFSMKLAEHGSLAQRASEWRGRHREAAQLISQIARAIDHAHQRGILHRDLKPGNILLGEGATAYVADFGIAKWLHRDSRLTLTQAALGTPHYIAPEQASGASSSLTPEADVYSLGAILYELLAGRPPFEADTALETLRLAAASKARPTRTMDARVPRDLDLICLKCLEKEPGARYSTAAALADDLDRWLIGRTILARSSTGLERTWRWTKRNPTLAGLSCALFVAVLILALVGWKQGLSIKPGPKTPAEASIAVLPFADQSQAKDREYFGDGISEEVIGALARVPGLRVIARSSSFSFKGKAVDAAEVGRKLNVSHVLEGTVSHTAGRVRITARLIEVRGGFYLWSETYDRPVVEVATIQNDITRKTADALQIKQAFTARPTARDSDAYDLYLRGLYFSNKSSEEDLRKSLAYFQQALDKDPTYPRAWTGIAKTWLWLADEYVKPLEAYPIVEAAATKAIALDDREAEAHAYLGEARRVLQWDYRQEEAELRKALEIDPNCAAAHLFLALLLYIDQPTQSAFDELAAARRLDQLSPIVSNFIVELSLAENRFDDAVREAKHMLELEPNYSYFDDSLAAAYRERGQLAESIALYESAAAVTQVPRPGLAIAYARAGRIEDARLVLARLLDRAKKTYVAADGIASIYVALGENDEAFRWLDRAAEEHSAPLEGIGRRITFRALRPDPRFAELLRKINLDPAKILSTQ